jgi:hypothetical protein
MRHPPQPKSAGNSLVAGNLAGNFRKKAVQRCFPSQILLSISVSCVPNSLLVRAGNFVTAAGNFLRRSENAAAHLYGRRIITIRGAAIIEKDPRVRA